MSQFFDVQTGLNDAVAAQIRSHLLAVTTLMPFLRKLNPNERKKVPSVKDGRLPIAKLGYEYARDHHVKLMLSNDLRDRILRNYNDFTYLRDIKRMVASMNEGLNDTIMMIGADCYRNALVVKDCTHNAEKRGEPGTAIMSQEISHLFTKGHTNGSVEEALGQGGPEPQV